MPQSTDIILNGAGYMVEPGSYKRLQDGMAEGRTERISITDFFGGQHRALQLERDKFNDSLAIGPALGGQGVRPWGMLEVLIGANAPNLTTGTITRSSNIPYAIVRDQLWFAVGTGLYSSPVLTHTGAWGYTLAYTYPNPITDLCIYGSSGILVAFGQAADIMFYNTLNGTTTALAATERGYNIEAYAGYAAWTDAKAASRPTIVRLVHGTGIDTRRLDHDPIAMTVIGGELMIVTKQSLYTYNGRVKHVLAPNPAYTVGGTQPQQIAMDEWMGEITPFFQQGVHASGDDYRLLVSYGGRTVAWIAGGVHEMVPSGDRAGWRSTGLEGRQCFGGCVVAGYVVVSIESYNGNNEIWAYDGNGWWRLAAQVMPAAGVGGTWVSPLPLGMTQYGINLVFFIEGETNKTLNLKLVESLTATGWNRALSASVSAQFVSPMIDAGERDKPKAWRKIGVVFSSPDRFHNLASADAVTVSLDYSSNSGASWTQIATTTKTGNSLASMNFELTANLSGAVSPFLMLRVRWDSVVDWTPILTGVWAEYEVLHNPARRRKWSMKIHARDQEIDRDGVQFTGGIAAEATTNLVRNPRAAVDVSGWANNQPATVSRDTAVGRTGGESFKVITTGSGSNQGIGSLFNVQQHLAAQGQTFTTSMYAKGTGNVRILLVERSVTNTSLTTLYTPTTIALTNNWQRLTWTTTIAHADAYHMTIALVTDGAQAVTFWVTDIQLEEKPYATTYCDGSLGAGHAWTGTPHASSSTRAYNDGLRTGRELIAELWASWQNDTAETFRDIDYDADPVQRTVRIVGISEAVAQPSDSNEWGDSIITLNLVEV